MLRMVSVTGHPSAPGRENSNGELFIFTTTEDAVTLASRWRRQAEYCYLGWSWQFFFQSVNAATYMSCATCGYRFEDWVDMPIFHFGDLHFHSMECFRRWGSKFRNKSN
jgi:hypothetical protein